MIFFHARRFCRAHQIARALVADARIAHQRRFHLVGSQAVGQVGQLVENHIGADVAHNFQQAFRVKRIRHQQHFAQRQANHAACARYEHFCFCAIFVSSDKG